MTSIVLGQEARIAAVDRFYQLLDRLAIKTGGPRALSQVDGSTGWPRRGVYFIFEPGEIRRESGSGLRVVRVGTHALKLGSKSTVRGRLSQHRGTRNPIGGNHRGSIFRLLVGLSLLKQNPALACATWSDGSSAPRAVRDLERPLEELVSGTIGAMSVLCLPVDDDPGPTSLRGVVERNTIALLSNLGKSPINPASPIWLGLNCPREKVVRSELWNNNHVEESCDPRFLDQLEGLIDSI